MNTRFHFLRTERYKTIQSLADASNITRSTLSAIENGRMNISTSHVEPLCKCFEVSSDFLLNRSDEGIMVHYRAESSTGKIVISLTEYQKYQNYIKIEANQRIIFGNAINEIQNDHESNNNNLMYAYSSIALGDSYSKEILSYLPRLTKEQKQMILSIIKSWEK